MTISSQTARIAYTGDGATTAFAVPFYFQANADLVVDLQDTLGNVTLQALGSNYSLTGATVSTGGTCTFTTAPPLGYLVTIYRDPPVTQTTSYNNNDPFPAKSHELALDKLTTLIQRLKDQITRTLHLGDGEAGLVTQLAPVSTRKNKLLGFDNNGTPVYSFGPGFVSGTYVGVAEIDSRATAVVTAFASSVNVVRTNGYSSAGDGGGAIYTRGSVSSPGAFQDGGGTYWGLDLTRGPINAKWFGVKADGVTSDSAALQAAFTAAAGREIALPAGTIVLTTQVAYNTGAGATFQAGLKLSGAGPEKTFIDNRVAGGSCIVAQSTAANFWQLGGFIRDLTVMTTTNPANSSGIEVKAVYQFRIENVHIIGLSANGGQVTNLLGDSDASNVILWRNCRFENCGGAGLLCNFAPGVTQTSFLRVEDCFFQGNVLAGYYYIGLQGVIINTAFAANTGPGLWIVYNGSSNAQLFCAANSFENNGSATVPQLRIDSMQGGEFYGTEIASTLIGFPAQVGISMAQALGSVQGTRIEGTRVRVSAIFNPYTVFKLYPVAILNVISNTMWQNYDATGQVRYSVDPSAYGNRISDSFDAVQVGDSLGAGSITLANGANNNVALSLDGAAFLILGPTGAFQINGFANGFDGRKLELHNNSGQVLTVNHEAAGSTAANRIHTDAGANITVNNSGTIIFRYISAISRWVVCGKG